MTRLGHWRSSERRTWFLFRWLLRLRHRRKMMGFKLAMLGWGGFLNHKEVRKGPDGISKTKSLPAGTVLSLDTHHSITSNKRPFFVQTQGTKRTKIVTLILLLASLWRIVCAIRQGVEKWRANICAPTFFHAHMLPQIQISRRQSWNVKSRPP